jgi:hypothetical protein
MYMCIFKLHVYIYIYCLPCHKRYFGDAEAILGMYLYKCINISIEEYSLIYICIYIHVYMPLMNLCLPCHKRYFGDPEAILGDYILFSSV